MFMYVTDDSKTESRIKKTFKITEWQYNDVNKSKHIRVLYKPHVVLFQHYREETLFNLEYSQYLENLYV